MTKHSFNDIAVRLDPRLECPIKQLCHTSHASSRMYILCYEQTKHTLRKTFPFTYEFYDEYFLLLIYTLLRE